MDKIYNEENGFPKAVSDILDELSMGIEYSRADDTDNKDFLKKGYYTKLFFYPPETGVEWYDYFLLENGTLKEFIDSANKYIEDFSIDGEADWILGECGIVSPGSTLEELAKGDAEYIFDTLRSFIESIEMAYPDLSNDVLINDNLLTDEKVEKYIAKNFADEEDVIMTYMKQASLQDKLDFLELPAKDIYGNIDNYIEDSIVNMPDDVFHDFAVDFGAKLMKKGITGNQDKNKEKAAERID